VDLTEFVVEDCQRFQSGPAAAPARSLFEDHAYGERGRKVLFLAVRAMIATVTAMRHRHLGNTMTVARKGNDIRREK
jgi:hypothetical protein